jgi:hypothetical protein
MYHYAKDQNDNYTEEAADTPACPRPTYCLLIDPPFDERLMERHCTAVKLHHKTTDCRLITSVILLKKFDSQKALTQRKNDLKFHWRSANFRD